MITSKIKQIRRVKKKCAVYDIVGVPKNHNFVANRMVVHNCDEAVRFACLDGDSLIDTPEGLVAIKDLEGKTNFKVVSYNEKTKQFEIQIAEKCVRTKQDYVYEVTTTSTTIKATKEHKFFTNKGWKRLDELSEGYKIFTHNYCFENIISIIKHSHTDVYDIINVQDNNNYIANGFVVHNSAADWNKKESKELRKKLAEVRTKHLLFILCFPLKIYKMEKNYLESFCNYWIDLFGRGLGAIYVKDRNPVNDSWRMKDFKNVGSYTEFTKLSEIEKKLKKHPNFWQVIRFPKPPAWLYSKYLEVREKNVYNDDTIRDMVTTEDVHKSLLLLALQDIMMNDTTLNMNRISLHIKNTYDIPISKKHIQNILLDSKQLITKIREETVG